MYKCTKNATETNIYAMSNIFLSNKLPLLQDVPLNSILNVNYLCDNMVLILKKKYIYLITIKNLIVWFPRDMQKKTTLLGP